MTTTHNHNSLVRTCTNCQTVHCPICCGIYIREESNPSQDKISCPACGLETNTYLSETPKPKQEKEETMLKKQDTDEYVEIIGNQLKEIAKTAIANSKKNNGLIWRRFALATYMQNATLSLINEDEDFNGYIDNYKKAVKEYYSYSHTVPTKILSKVMNATCQTSFFVMKIGFNLAK
jgi:hypothetical protein